MPTTSEADPSQTATDVRPQAGSAPVPSSIAAYQLEVTTGMDVGLRVLVEPMRPGRLLVGTSPVCELRLTDRLVSRRHAAIEAAARGLRITDLGSTNGTSVQGVAILEAYLRGGEVLKLGDTLVRVTPVDPSQDAGASNATRFGKLLGRSSAMRRLYPLCERLAASTVPVVIEGETGTGKEQLAEALHESGPRASEPFVVFDCTTVSPSLMESALFGHERGAFTGAVAFKKGAFEAANGGTLLIDEIGDLELSLQAKLLRAIEKGEIQRVGGDRWFKFDVRVMAATRRNLDQEVQANRFRDDLFYRLAVARIELPPLRQREEDVGLLARHFWRVLGGTDSPPDDFLRRLESYDWPGNVRELHHAVLRRVALGDLAGESVVPMPARPAAASAARDFIEETLAANLPFPRARDDVLAEFERRYVEHVLSLHRGSVARAAAASGIARRYFQAIRARHTQRPGASDDE